MSSVSIPCKRSHRKRSKSKSISKSLSSPRQYGCTVWLRLSNRRRSLRRRRRLPRPKNEARQLRNRFRARARTRTTKMQSTKRLVTDYLPRVRMGPVRVSHLRDPRVRSQLQLSPRRGQSLRSSGPKRRRRPRSQLPLCQLRPWPPKKAEEIASKSTTNDPSLKINPTMKSFIWRFKL